jgi:hypothetical protein
MAPSLRARRSRKLDAHRCRSSPRRSNHPGRARLRLARTARPDSWPTRIHQPERAARARPRSEMQQPCSASDARLMPWPPGSTSPAISAARQHRVCRRVTPLCPPSATPTRPPPHPHASSRPVEPPARPHPYHASAARHAHRESMRPHGGGGAPGSAGVGGALIQASARRAELGEAPEGAPARPAPQTRVPRPLLAITPSPAAVHAFPAAPW